MGHRIVWLWAVLLSGLEFGGRVFFQIVVSMHLCNARTCATGLHCILAFANQDIGLYIKAVGMNL
jgi:hypothetical protein